MSISDLDSVIAKLRYVKYGDYVLSDDHNDLVDAVKIIRDILKGLRVELEGDYSKWTLKWTKDLTRDVECAYYRGYTDLDKWEEWYVLAFVGDNGISYICSGLITEMVSPADSYLAIIDKDGKVLHHDYAYLGKNPIAYWKKYVDGYDTGAFWSVAQNPVSIAGKYLAVWNTETSKIDIFKDGSKVYEVDPLGDLGKGEKAVHWSFSPNGKYLLVLVGNVETDPATGIDMGIMYGLLYEGS